MLRHDQWARIEMLCSGKSNDRGVTGRDNRLFVEAVLWVARTGAPWRDLPRRFGPWHTAYVRFSRWSKKGIWARIVAALEGDADLAHLFLDSTIARARRRAAVAKKSATQRRRIARNAD